MKIRSLLLIPALAVAGAAHGVLIINQVYGGGGGSTGTLRNDYVELFNNGTAAVSLSGLSLQYGSATGTFGSSASNIAVLNDFSLPAGGYYLLRLGTTGTSGVDSTATPDQTVGTVNLSSTAGKLILYRGTTNVNTLDPDSANVLDLVGYGSTANRFEGATFAPATTTTAVISRTAGIDTNQNGVDFIATSVTAGSFRSSAQATPEPASLAALGVGAIALLRRRRAAK